MLGTRLAKLNQRKSAEKPQKLLQPGYSDLTFDRARAFAGEFQTADRLTAAEQQ
jgi:hypothetical protein